VRAVARPRLVSDAQILDAVREGVRQHGPRVSLNEVAGKVGVSQPALLKRFGSRQQLMLAALVRQTPPPWFSHVEAGPDERPLRAQLEDVVGQIARDMEEQLPFLSALRESGIPQDTLCSHMRPSPAMNGLHALTGWLTRAAERGLVDGRGLNLESTAAAMMGAVVARAQVQHLFQAPWTQADTAAFVRDVTEMFVRVLTPSAAHPPLKEGAA
jgi:AcrR family transcriptional regulator